MKLPQHTGSLEPMSGLASFERATAVNAACPRPDLGRGGQPPYPPLVMVKVLFLQTLYHLPNEQALMRCGRFSGSLSVMGAP
ncbi:transposase [Caldimonas tepidiphila]|uniref:transposase n=1 Tax=Caldimonas tepidiphila TaxID=2315841 RepID=UPI000E5AFBB8|nr:transposase [Caldimonas tepidiphila]